MSKYLIHVELVCVFGSLTIFTLAVHPDRLSGDSQSTSNLLANVMRRMGGLHALCKVSTGGVVNGRHMDGLFISIINAALKSTLACLAQTEIIELATRIAIFWGEEYFTFDGYEYASLLEEIRAAQEAQHRLIILHQRQRNSILLLSQKAQSAICRSNKRTSYKFVLCPHMKPTISHHLPVHISLYQYI